MKNRIMKVLATIIFMVFLPLMSIGLLLKYSGNPVWRIKRNFQAVMFIVNLGHPKIVIEKTSTVSIVSI